MNLRGLDLNLLVVFDAVMAERNVHRAAERIGLSQPATSNALKRLRLALDDPLFVRSPQGMVPTARAEALAPDVRAALSLVEGVMARTERFDPRRARRAVNLGMTDFGAAVLLPRIAKRLGRFSDGLTLRVPLVDAKTYRTMLDDGRIDLAIGLLPEGDARHGREVLFRDTWTVLADRSNDHVREPMDAGIYAALEHVVFSPHGEPVTVVDRLLRRQGIRRKAVVTVSHFGMISALIAGSDRIATISQRLAGLYARSGGFKTARLPFLTEHFDVVQVWNRRYDRDPALSWIREQVRAAAITGP